MKVILIRHGDPDYVKDSLTEKGWREAKLLADRVCRWDVRDFYVSPLGRARDTANVSLERLGRTAEVKDWLKEFYVDIKDPETGNNRIPWDFMPAYWTKRDMLYDRNHWMEDEIMTTGPVKEEFEKVCRGIDDLLAGYGYKRKDAYYEVEHSNTDTIVIFCHLGVSFAILSHLLGISAPALWQGFFVAPTSVTLLSTEERIKGQACFRVKKFGDCSHLYVGDETPSESGFFIEAQ